jgi:hypothetical protein
MIRNLLIGLGVLVVLGASGAFTHGQDHTHHGGAYIAYEGAAQPGTGGNTNWHEMTGCTASPDLEGFTHSDCDLTAEFEGHYQIIYGLSFIGNTAETYLTAIAAGNPADVVPEATGCNSARKIGTGTDVGFMGGNCSVVLSKDDVVRVIVKSVGGGASDLTAKTFDFDIHQL